jgi:hypothetical protein
MQNINIKVIFASICLLIVASNLSHAASDTDVFKIQASKVTVEEDKIIIVAKAEIALNNIQGLLLQGMRIKTEITIFIIYRPKLDFNDPDGTHAKEKEQSRKVLDDAWKMTLESAKDLQDGKEVGRIGYYMPEIVINGNKVQSIKGEGYIYPISK